MLFFSQIYLSSMLSPCLFFLKFYLSHAYKVHAYEKENMYVSLSTHKFYLSRVALVQIGVIPSNFPQVGDALEASSIENKVA